MMPDQPPAFPTIAGLPIVTGEQMAAADRAMFDRCGLDLLQVMEMAGWSVADFARQRFLDNDPRDARVAVLCGIGGNGGDGMVAARYLQGWGAQVEVVVSSDPDPNRGAAHHQLQVLERIGVPATVSSTVEGLEDVRLIIDGLLGFGSRGSPRGAVADLIRVVNDSPAPILAIDLPSGLDATTGEPGDPCIRAAATLTLALPKSGLLTPAGLSVAGDLTVADIGVPPAAYDEAGIPSTPAFASTRLIDLVREGQRLGAR